MLEFVRKEVWCMEEAEITRASLLSFFLNGHREDIVVLLNRGVFCKYMTYESLLYDIPGNDCFVTVGENIFYEAESFFEEKVNRLRLLPVVDCSGNLISFLRWNNQKRENGQPDQRLEEIEKAPRLLLRECSESIYLWLRDFLKEHTGKEFVLQGEGWEVLTACQAVPMGGNIVTMSMEEEISDALELTFGRIPQIIVNSVKSIWELKEAYYSYRIFVRLENKADVDIFTRLAFSGIRVEGFCSSGGNSLCTFLDKPVWEPQVLLEEPDVLLVFPDGQESWKEKFTNGKPLCLSYSALFEVRRELQEQQIVILYDSSQEAKRITGNLEKHGLQVWGYCPIGVSQNKIADGKMVSKEELMKRADCYHIILASATVYFEKSLYALQNKNLQIFVPGRDIFYRATLYIMLGNVCWYLDKAFQAGKKMVLYGADTCFTNAWLSFFYRLGKEVDNIVNDIYDLAYEDTSDTFIILNNKIEQWVSSCELLESLGFSEFNENYAGLYAVSYRHLEEKKDVTLGHVTGTLLDNTRYPGFSVYGGEEAQDLRIVILGGSTSTSEAYRVPCWPQLMYERLHHEGKCVTIYNGAVDGYTSCAELYKLIRDVGRLNPHVVVSFSGVNNIVKEEYPYTFQHLNHIFNDIFRDDYSKGLREEALSAAQIWVQQEQMMEAICRSVYHAQFFCFVQPMYLSKGELLAGERLKFEHDESYRRAALKFRAEASEIARKFAWMVDLQDILDESPEVFFDSMHVDGAGNRMIADAVYAHLIGEFKEK